MLQENKKQNLSKIKNRQKRDLEAGSGAATDLPPCDLGKAPARALTGWRSRERQGLEQSWGNDLLPQGALSASDSQVSTAS